jgi:hypothetical protein
VRAGRLEFLEVVEVVVEPGIKIPLNIRWDIFVRHVSISILIFSYLELAIPSVSTFKGLSWYLHLHSCMPIVYIDQRRQQVPLRCIVHDPVKPIGHSFCRSMLPEVCAPVFARIFSSLSRYNYSLKIHFEFGMSSFNYSCKMLAEASKKQNERSYLVRQPIQQLDAQYHDQ